MAIEKSPLESSMEDETPIEIELEQSLGEPDGSKTFLVQEDGSFLDADEFEEQSRIEFGENIAESLDEGELNEIASELTSLFEEDLESRDDWFQTFTKGLDLLGINGEDRSEPFVGASGVHHPILAEAVTQFQAQAYKELLPAGGPVDVEILGKTDDAKVSRGNRVKNFMNYQITCRMEEYDPEMDQLLFYLPLSGSAFKKIYYDPSLGRASARFIKAEDLVVPYYAVDLLTSPRITHVINMTENELRKMQLSGFYRDVDLGNPGADIGSNEVDDKIDEIQGISKTISEEEYTLLEVHVDLDIEGNGQFFMSIRRFVPDFKTLQGNAKVTLAVKRYPQQSETTTSLSPFTITSSTDKKDTRARGRYVNVKIENDSASESWRFGTFKIDIQPDGRR